MIRSLIKQFNANFRWGVATAAYQIEGAVNEDGRGPSIWDTFSHSPGRTFNRDNGDVSCDHYHQFRQDIQLMAQLGIPGYRFSVSWPRIFPTGKGKVNSRGIDFYDRLVDTLLQANIHPLITLYHWDLPESLQEKGGWMNRDTAYYVRDYAQTLGEHLADRARNWITHNEPWVVSVAGHLQRCHAPGLKRLDKVRVVAHHLLLSHGLTVEAFRASGYGQIGITLNLHPVYSASDQEQDLEAQRLHDVFQNRWFLDPVIRGTYPVALDQILPPISDTEVKDGDLAIISQPLDFLGVNYYAPHKVFYDPAQLDKASLLIREDEPVTAMGWPINAHALTDLLVGIHQDYGPIPLLITENGAAYDDVLEAGQVHDTLRQQYLLSHWQAVRDALALGIPVEGYYLWSLLDNFEWALGYSKRFGIIYVDYLTQRRTIKDSGLLYRNLIQEFREYHQKSF